MCVRIIRVLLFFGFFFLYFMPKVARTFFVLLVFLRSCHIMTLDVCSRHGRLLICMLVNGTALQRYL